MKSIKFTVGIFPPKFKGAYIAKPPVCATGPATTTTTSTTTTTPGPTYPCSQGLDHEIVSYSGGVYTWNASGLIHCGSGAQSVPVTWSPSRTGQPASLTNNSPFSFNWQSTDYIACLTMTTGSGAGATSTTSCLGGD